MTHSREKSAKKFELISPYAPAGDQGKAIEALSAGFANGLAEQVLLGVTGSGKTYTVANVIQNLARPALIMAHNKTLAAQLYGEMKEFFPHNAVEYFVSYYDYYQPEAYVPSSDTYIEKDASVNQHIEQMRLSATKALMERRDVVIVATVSAIYGLGDPNSYLQMMLHLVRGDVISVGEIVRRLVEIQYNRNDVELARGTFRVRGEVIDVFAADSEKYALRIELFDGEVENLSYFDPLTGQLVQKLARATVYPKTHYVTPREILLNMIDAVQDELKARLSELRAQDKLVEAQRLEQRTQYDMEMIRELGYCNGIENYSRYLSGKKAGEPPPCLLDYFPKDGLMIIDESHVTVSQIGAMFKGDRSRKQNLVDYGFRLPSALDNRPLQFAEFEQIKGQTLYVSATPGDYELARADNVVEQLVRPTGLVDPLVEIQPVATQVEAVMDAVRERAKLNERVLVTTLTKRMAEDLTDYLMQHNIKVRYLHSDIDTVERVEIIRDLRLGVFDVLVGINLLREGLDMPEVSLVAILDADKEGFLRSQRSLIQTIGRAARHLNGKAILFADSITKSMQAAIEESERRRQTQLAYNEKHHIRPQSVARPISDILEAPQLQFKKSKSAKSAPSSAAKVDAKTLADPVKLGKYIQKLEKQMLQYAADLEFEQAAQLRDEIAELTEQWRAL